MRANLDLVLSPELRGLWRAVGQPAWGVGAKPGTQMVLERWMMEAEAGGQVRSQPCVHDCPPAPNRLGFDPNQSAGCQVRAMRKCGVRGHPAASTGRGQIRPEP